MIKPKGTRHPPPKQKFPASR